MDAVFDYGEKVRVIKNIRNDGTFMGSDRGELIIRRGSEGYIKGVGKFLQDQVIYQVHFMEQGCTVGCRESELSNLQAPWVARLFERGDHIVALQTLTSAGKILVEAGNKGTILGLKDESEPLIYRVSFANNKNDDINMNAWLIPESAMAIDTSLPQQLGRGK